MPAWLVILLGSLSAVGPLSTDMYLPAFPAIQASLGSTGGAAQATLAVWFLGLAVGQFTQGPASDRWGRRAPLLFGMAVYTVGSLGCTLSHDIWSFCAFRFLAALGGSAGMVIPRAIVRDIATGVRGSRLMSQLTLVLGVVPVLAPSLGSLVLGFASWRWIFLIATIYGIVEFLTVWRVLPDTLPPPVRLKLSPLDVFRRVYTIVREPVFLANSCICGFGTFIIFAYLAGTPIVFERIRHFTPTQFGLVFGFNAACYITGTQLNARYAYRVGLARLLRFGLMAMAASALLLLLVALSGLADPRYPLLFVAVPVLGVMTSMGFITPNATVLALGGHARHAGSASALLGTMQFSFGAVSGVMMSLFPQVSVLPMAAIILLGVAGALLFFWFYRRHAAHG